MKDPVQPDTTQPISTGNSEPFPAPQTSILTNQPNTVFSAANSSQPIPIASQNTEPMSQPVTQMPPRQDPQQVKNPVPAQLPVTPVIEAATTQQSPVATVVSQTNQQGALDNPGQIPQMAEPFPSAPSNVLDTQNVPNTESFSRQPLPSNTPPVTTAPTYSVAPQIQEPVIMPTLTPEQTTPPISNSGNTPRKKSLIPIIAVIAVLFLIVLAFVFRSLLLNKVPNLGRKGEIVWWGFTEEERAVAPLIKEFESNNPGVKVTYIKQSPQDFRERLQNSLAAGKGPDIFEIHNSWVPLFINDVDPLPNSIMTASDFTQTYYPVIVSDLKTAKGIVGLPLQYDALTLYINQELFAAAAQMPPTTWDEFRQKAPALAGTGVKGQAVQSAVPMGTTTNVDHWPEIVSLLLLQNNVNLSKPVGARVVDGLEFYRSFTTLGKWQATYPQSTIAFARGQAAMYFGPVRRAAEIIAENPNLQFKTVPLPQIANERPEDPKMSYATYWFEGVWKKSSEKENAWKLLSFLSQSDTLQKLQSNRPLPKPYPRMEMKLLQAEDPLLGSVITLAPYAKSWYMADELSGGAGGINNQLNQLYKPYLDAGNVDDAGVEIAPKIQQTLSKYGISVK